MNSGMNPNRHADSSRANPPRLLIPTTMRREHIARGVVGPYLVGRATPGHVLSSIDIYLGGYWALGSI